MFIIGFLLLAVARVLDFILLFFMIFIIARAVLSWVSPDPYNPIVRFIDRVTEPVLFRIRTKIPVVYGGIDFSPLIVFLVIIFLRDFLVKSIAGMGRSLL
jgi:YggT family protein